MLALQREAAWAKERLLGDLRQSVPQNGRVHLHIIDERNRTVHVKLSRIKDQLVTASRGSSQKDQ